MTNAISYKRSLELKEEGHFLWRQQEVSRFLNRLSQYLSVQGKDTLEVGSGFGSTCYLLCEKGANATGIDIDDHLLSRAQEFCIGKKAMFLRNSAENLEFEDKSFDLVTFFGTLEHVMSPEKAMKEANRVLRDGGFVQLEFPPYYSLAGHHLYEYTILPVQFFPKRILRWYIMRGGFNPLLTKEPFDSSQEYLAHREWHLEEFDKLSRFTIQRLYRISNELKMNILDERFVIKYPPRIDISIPFMKYMGPIKELVFSYQAILQKQPIEENPSCH